MKNNKAQDNIKAVGSIRSKLNAGSIDYYQAKNELKPVIDRMNQDGQRIAKKYGRKFKPFNATGLLR